MKQALSQRCYFVLLLPAFFVLHGYAAQPQYIRPGGLLPLLASFLAASGLLYLILRSLLKESRKAGLITLYCMGFYFFFGALYDFLKAWSPWTFLYKYSVLLAGFLLSVILLFYWLRRSKKEWSKAVYFFNLLFLIFIVADLVKLTGKLWTKSNTTAATGKMNIPPGVHKPDIYLLLFDEYSSTRTLKTIYGFDNSGLDSFLVQAGFHLMPDSRSNYPETSFSMASFLNMDYLHWLRPGMPVTREHYQRCAEEVRNNRVMQELTNNGYEIINQSIFDLKHHPAPVSQRWLNIDTRLITEETLAGRLFYEFNWFFNRYAFLRKILPVTSYQEQMQNNDRCLAGVLNTSKEKSSHPRFVYGHFLLPHFPFYKDKNGNMLPDSIVNATMEEKLDPLPQYLDYLQYANMEVKKLITGIHANDPGAVIIFLSDHGYRWTVPTEQFSTVFHNQNAIYLPSKRYEGFYDSITNVNQFRAIFNSLFDAQYPLLKDTSIPVQPEHQ